MSTAPGTVFLVGAGPGDPGLITVRGLRLLQQADVVLYDRLIPKELLAETKPGAELVDVGKAPGQHRFAQPWINALLVSGAREGQSVVRLKGGDPFVFGRGYEELLACRDAGVNCLVIPGVSSAIAGPAAAGIPITQRGVVQTVAIVTAQVAKDGSHPPLDYAALAAMDTVVVLMGRAKLSELTRGLMAAGKSPACPAACVQNATTDEQRVVRSTLGQLAEAVDRAGLKSPVVTVVGEVAACAATSEQHALWSALTGGADATSEAV